MTTRIKPLCIYHADCADGFSAAWVVNKYFNGEVDFYRGVYQDTPPDVRGRKLVYLVDFSYKRNVMTEIINEAVSVTVLDHHKSAMEDLAGLKGLLGVFDMNKCGARVTWEYFYGDTPPPKLLDHVEDRDLWRFKLNGTREIQANVFSYPYTFETWDSLMSADVEELRRDGAAIERKHFKDIHELLPRVTRRMNIGGYSVPVANLPYIYSSDAGHELAKGEPFAACYWDTPSGRQFSLRSEGYDAVDVSQIAALYGGGGHRGAAGFKVSYAKATTFEVP